MRCVEISQPGGPEVLIAANRQTPAPANDEILIQVAAAGVNRPDALQRAGAYPPPPGASDLPGLEVAGTVAAIGADVTRWRVGDAVCALTPGGGYADYCLTHADHALPIPSGPDGPLSMIAAAALPETVFTVWTNLFQRGALKAGESVLIHGGSSGIGTTAIQLAALTGARVFATAGSAEKCAACLRLGAERAINYREEDFVAIAREATGGRGVDVILDMVGGAYLPRNFDLAAPDGRIVNIAFLQGATAEVNFAPAMVKRLTWSGSTLRPRTIEFKAALAREIEATVWPWIAQGRFAPVMDRSYPLTQASQAHARMESSEHIGKITLTV
ncbi:MAG: NAD(P)H-quinone oxidoreductase [Rhodobacteraceae bacterium]|nr:NAD(P)H-quinone oxidoreductase [Paracoccaceae bacterium]